MGEKWDMQVTIQVCDVCKEPDKDTRAYELKQGARKALVDLCADDAAPIEAFLDQEPPKGQPGAVDGAQRRGRRSNRVTTIEEIERRKAEKRP